MIKSLGLFNFNNHDASFVIVLKHSIYKAISTDPFQLANDLHAIGDGHTMDRPTKTSLSNLQELG